NRTVPPPPRENRRRDLSDGLSLPLRPRRVRPLEPRLRPRPHRRPLAPRFPASDARRARAAPPLAQRLHLPPPPSPRARPEKDPPPPPLEGARLPALEPIRHLH